MSVRYAIAAVILCASGALSVGLVGCSSDEGARDAGVSGGDAAAARDDAAAPADAGLHADATPPVSEDAGASADADPITPTDAAPLAEDASMPPRTVHAYGALGSSSTAGSGATRADLAYVPRLYARLLGHRAGAGGVELVNRGSGGARIDTLLGALPDLEARRPEVVTILPLTDFVQTDAARFRSGYDELFRRLGAVGSTIFFGDLRIDPMYLCNGGVSGPGGCYGEEDRALLGGKNTIVAELAALHPHVIVVPVFDQNAAHPEWNANDGHPNDRGHQYLADTFWAAIEPWLR